MTSATFTLPLKSVIELTGGKAPVVDGVRIYTPGNDGIGLEHYPIFDTNYRAMLNGKIIDHYWNREIGRETVDDFQRALRMTMNEIMTYYNKLYKSEQIEFDPLRTIDLRTIGNVSNTVERTASSDSTATTDSTNTSNNGATAISRSVASEMPGQMLAGNKDYATSATDGNSQTTSTAADAAHGESETATTDTGKEDALQENESTTTGYQGVPTELIMRYRESLLNIDLAIIGELESLFMGVWNNGDEFAGWSY